MNTEKKTKPENDINKKTPKPLNDLDDFIFDDEDIKYHSER